MPGVAMRLVDACGRDDVCLSQVASVLQQDPALTSKVLRYANSAVFGMSASVTSVHRAAVLLGLLTLQTTALSFTLLGNLQSAKCGAFDHTRYWRRSLFCAAGAQALGERLGELPTGLTPESLFICGLLDDLGMLILAHALGPEYTKVLASCGPLHSDVVAAERKKLGFDHSAVTAWMEREWRLPAVMVGAAEGSHAAAEANAAGLRSNGSLASTLALASMIADIFAVANVPAASARAHAVASRSYGLSAPVFSKVLERTMKLASVGAGLLDIDAGDPETNARILDDARECMLSASIRSTIERNSLLDESQRDPLTGLWNRGHLDRAVSTAFRTAVDDGQPLTVAFIDIDHFKQVNDRYGHATGDLVLKAVATRVAGMVRATDLVARYGGEEFVVLYPGVGTPLAHKLCERLCARIAEEPIEIAPGRTIDVTISVGFAASDRPMIGSADELLKLADTALYAAKRAGRNRARAA